MSSVIKKNLIISDFDMTLFNFKEVDNRIIKEIFGKYRFVLLIDKFLWKINSLGIVGNSMKGLKVRLFIYSLLTLFTRYIKYNDVFIKYEIMYKKLAMKKYKRKIWLIKKIQRKGYEFVILTNNKFASELGIPYITYSENKRKFLNKSKPEFLFGDNFWDDYRNCPKGTKFVTVGGGILSKFKHISNIKNMYEVFEVLE